MHNHNNCYVRGKSYLHIWVGCGLIMLMIIPVRPAPALLQCTVVPICTYTSRCIREKKKKNRKLIQPCCCLTRMSTELHDFRTCLDSCFFEPEFSLQSVSSCFSHLLNISFIFSQKHFLAF